MKDLRGMEDINDKLADYVVIGSGLGAAGVVMKLLAQDKCSIVVLERGDFPTSETKFTLGQSDLWHRVPSQGSSATLAPWMYCVGGNSILYGSCLQRFPSQDFDRWPISYKEIASFYTEAEHILSVHGSAALPPVPHTANVEKIARRLESVGLFVSSLPCGIDLSRGKCLCDGKPCPVGAKSTALSCVWENTPSDRVELKTGCTVQKLLVNSSGDQISSVVYEKNGSERHVSARKAYVLAAGAINSPAILLRSRSNPHHPDGIGNNNGHVGKHLLGHNVTAMCLWSPWLYCGNAAGTKTINMIQYLDQKSTVQSLGVSLTHVFMSQKGRLVGWLYSKFGKFFEERCLNIIVQTEDFPSAFNKVIVEDSKTIVSYEPHDIAPHQKVVDDFASRAKRAGFYPIGARLNRRISVHSSGTLRIGRNQADSVTNSYGQVHGIKNLYVSDSSLLPTISSVNPALTVFALGLRIGDYLKSQI